MFGRVFKRLESSIARNHTFVEFNTIPKNSTGLLTHELLQKLGYFKQPSAGIVHWLPNGIKSINKIENIIRKRMDEVEFEEVSLSSLSGSALWEKTKRWENTELFKLDDDKFCLVATCEEEIADLANNTVSSYKQLPLLVYQINRKYRNEKRPRFGLLRGKEFIMKDAYSFDIDKEHALSTFKSVNGAYAKIFTDLKIPFIPANADSGDIGGNLSTEWHLVHQTGEDILMKCDHCSSASNIEKAISYPKKDAPPSKLAKVKYFTDLENETLIALYFPSDRSLVSSFVKEEINNINLKDEKLTNEQVLKKFLNENIDENQAAVKQVIRVIDPRVTSKTELPDFPSEVKFQRNSFTTFNDISIVESVEGEVCGECNKGHLEAFKLIEVGHTFYLGTKYSRDLNATFIDAKDKSNFFEMGCYGIGVSRLLASIAEILRDDKGLVLPAIIAPYELTVISNESDENLEQLLSNLKDERIDFQKDFRKNKLKIPLKIKESQMIGIPLSLIYSKKNFPKVEIEVRSRKLSKKLDDLKKFYESEKGSLDWEMTTDNFGNEKHFVDMSNAAKLVKYLLKDL